MTFVTHTRYANCVGSGTHLSLHNARNRLRRESCCTSRSTLSWNHVLFPASRLLREKQEKGKEKKRTRLRKQPSFVNEMQRNTATERDSCAAVRKKTALYGKLQMHEPTDGHEDYKVLCSYSRPSFRVAS